ncbi:uncharacterized protein L201_000475 [Kwoniella dendrophila CBS 6074]|uniref:Uncharacterized protein n=1 Tax=Kwoniella dendrophila CBS 6074 TaxID=1295534 RepID=A0AAX4JKV3_9TREE
MNLYFYRLNRPLPVERSQGSVSALVARFQTAANRDAEATARENRRASLQPNSNGNSRRTSTNGLWTPSPGNTPKLGESAILPSADLPSGSSQKVETQDSQEKKEEGTAEKDGSNSNGVGVKDILNKPGDKLQQAEDKFKDLVIKTEDECKDKGKENASKSKPDPIEITKEDVTKSSPSRPPKSPKRLSSSNVMSPLPVPVSTTETDIAPKKDITLSEAEKEKVEQPKAVVTSREGEDKSTPSKPTPSKTPSSTKKSFPTPSNSRSTINQTPASASTTSTPTSATKTRSRLSSGPISSTKSTTTTPSATTNPTRSRTSLGHQSTPSSTARTKSSANRRESSESAVKPSHPPSSFNRTPKPLVASHTGPSGSSIRRPSSSAQGNVPSPLKPQLTGTPSKPTASSLAKARIPSATTPNSTTKSTKRESLSLGKSSGSVTRSSIGRGDSTSPSPAGNTKDISSTPSKISSSGGSRLLQGTAASRARSAGMQHHDSPSKTHPSNSSSTNTPSKVTVAGQAPKPQSSSTSSTRTPINQNRTKSSSASSTSTSRVRVKPQKSTNNENEKKRTESKGDDEKDLPKTPSVGFSPIGRLGLAAANMKRPEGPLTEQGQKAREEGKIGDSAQENTNNSLEENGHFRQASNDEKEHEVDVVKAELQKQHQASEERQNETVSKETNQQDSKEAESTFESHLNPKAHKNDNGIESKSVESVNDHNDDEDSINIGEESLEEIPDIE